MDKIVVDIETYDPQLSDLGPGCIRKDGHILVAGIYDGYTYRSFYPKDKVDNGKVIRKSNWEVFENIMRDPSVVKIAHNGVYDYDWIQNGYGIKIEGRLEDTMTRAGLLNEYQGSYSLDTCCQLMQVEGKNFDDSIVSWFTEQGIKGDPMKNIGLVPDEVMERYNKQDCIATFNLYEKQQPELERQGLIACNELECDVLRVVLELRKNGIRIDQIKLADATRDTKAVLEQGMRDLDMSYGIISLTKKKGEGSILYRLERMGVTEHLFNTPSGGKSVAFDSLMHLRGTANRQDVTELVDKIVYLSHKNALLTKYLESAFTKFTIGGRIHGSFYPTQRDDGGTLTARFASQKPNMQNFSYMKDKDGPLVRGIFIPDEGHWMLRADYSQIEYRLLAHYAVGPGSMKLREEMCNGRDYHGVVQEMLGWFGPDGRRRTKNFNFGMLYGMGLNTFKSTFEELSREAAKEMGMTTDAYTTHYYNEYMRRMTFVRPTLMSIQEIAKRQGYIDDICGRRHRMPPDNAAYKMVNYVIQGGAAGINKRGLAASYAAGIFNVLKIHVTLHDEIVCSVPPSKEGLEACQELVKTMCGVAALKVPILMEPGMGTNWYAAGTDEGKEQYDKLLKEFGLC